MPISKKNSKVWKTNCLEKTNKSFGLQKLTTQWKQFQVDIEYKTKQFVECQKPFEKFDLSFKVELVFGAFIIPYKFRVIFRTQNRKNKIDKNERYVLQWNSTFHFYIASSYDFECKLSYIQQEINLIIIRQINKTQQTNKYKNWSSIVICKYNIEVQLDDKFCLLKVCPYIISFNESSRKFVSDTP